MHFCSAVWREGWNFGEWFTLMGENSWSDVPTEVTAVRRRNEKSRVAILTATRELLLEHGFRTNPGGRAPGVRPHQPGLVFPVCSPPGRLEAPPSFVARPLFSARLRGAYKVSPSLVARPSLLSPGSTAPPPVRLAPESRRHRAPLARSPCRPTRSGTG